MFSHHLHKIQYNFVLELSVIIWTTTVTRLVTPTTYSLDHIKNIIISDINIKKLRIELLRKPFILFQNLNIL